MSQTERHRDRDTFCCIKNESNCIRRGQLFSSFLLMLGLRAAMENDIPQPSQMAQLLIGRSSN